MRQSVLASIDQSEWVYAAGLEGTLSPKAATCEWRIESLASDYWLSKTMAELRAIVASSRDAKGTAKASIPSKLRATL